MRVRLPSYLAVVGWLLCIGVILDPGSLRAQTSSFGVIVGVVTDTSQAAIPDVSLTITSVAMGTTRQLKTNQAGEYRVDSLLPGMYRIKAERTGFQTAEVKDAELPVARTVTVNITMQVGMVTQTMEVKAAAPLLDTQNATVGTVVNPRSVVSLPLNGRSFTDLIQMMPGAVGRGTVYAVSGGTNYNVNGVHSDQNVYTLDGVNAGEIFFKQFGIQPSIDALQEFKVQTHNSADYGSGAGANVNLVIKSGSNQLHGSLFEFVRNDKFDAVTWFTNATSAAGAAKRPPFRQNQYGFVLGGPVYIPNVYDGRNKFFWLFNFEGRKTRNPTIRSAYIPTTAQLNGDFRDYPAIYDPETTDPVTLDREQFSYNGVLNMIAPERLHPGTHALAEMFYPDSSTNQIYSTNTLKIDQPQYHTRVDYKFTEKLQFYARYSQSSAQQSQLYQLGTYTRYVANQFRNGVLSWTYLASPTTVMDFRLGANRGYTFISTDTPEPGALAWYAAHPVQGLKPASPDYPILFSVGISGYTGFSQSASPFPVTDLQGIFNLTKIRGKHTFRVGVNYDNLRGRQVNYGNTGLSWVSMTTAHPEISGTGEAAASFMLGLPNNGYRNLGDLAVDLRWANHHFYLADDIRLTSRLTVNLGLRYEYNQLPRDRDDRFAQYDRYTQQYIWASTNPVTGESANVRRTVRDPDFNNFAPRIGIAYQINSKTTVRSGYGIFYGANTLWEMQGPRGNWPYAISETQSGMNQYDPTTFTPIETFWGDYTEPLADTPASCQYANDRLSRSSYTQMWNLHVQRELASNLLLEVGYVGTKGTKMPLFWGPNIPAAGPGDIAERRPYQGVGDFSEGTNRASTNYHALQGRLEKRFSNGLQFLATYAWAHLIDIGGGGLIEWGGPVNPYNWAADRGDSNYDRRHVLTTSYVYQLPFGRGKRYLTNAGGFVNQLLGGWEVTGVTRFMSGAPITIYYDGDQANTGQYGGQRPDVVASQSRRLASTDKTLGWLNPAAYALPADYTYGNLARNSERGDWYRNWDIGVFKNFPLRGEKTMLQFRAEFFNAFNNVVMGAPDSYWCQAATGDPVAGQAGSCNPTFGHVTSTENRARQIQFGLKLLF